MVVLVLLLISFIFTLIFAIISFRDANLKKLIEEKDKKIKELEERLEVLNQVYEGLKSEYEELERRLEERTL